MRTVIVDEMVDVVIKHQLRITRDDARSMSEELCEKLKNLADKQKYGN